MMMIIHEIFFTGHYIEFLKWCVDDNITIWSRKELYGLFDGKSAPLVYQPISVHDMQDTITFLAGFNKRRSRIIFISDDDISLMKIKYASHIEVRRELIINPSSGRELFVASESADSFQLD